MVSLIVSLSVVVTVTVKIWLGGIGVMISRPSDVDDDLSSDVAVGLLVISGEEDDGE